MDPLRIYQPRYRRTPILVIIASDRENDKWCDMDSVQRKGTALENEANSFRSALRLHASTREKACATRWLSKHVSKPPGPHYRVRTIVGWKGEKERESERVGRHLIHR